MNILVVLSIAPDTETRVLPGLTVCEGERHVYSRMRCRKGATPTHYACSKVGGAGATAFVLVNLISDGEIDSSLAEHHPPLSAPIR